MAEVRRGDWKQSRGSADNQEREGGTGLTREGQWVPLGEKTLGGRGRHARSGALISWSGLGDRVCWGVSAGALHSLWCPGPAAEPALC